MKIVNVPIKELKPNKQNPRQIKEADYLRLKESIEKFGLIDPIIVNSNKKRKNVVIGGHMRLRVASELAYATVPVIYLDLTLPKEKELNLRLNKNGGEWDKDALANYFELEDLIDIGFKHVELGLNIDKIDLPKEVDLLDEEEAEYDEDVAKKYDKYYSKDEFKKEDKFIMELLQKNLATGKTLDIGSGTGFLLDNMHFGSDNYVGNDISQPMIDVAKNKHPDNLFVRKKITGIFGYFPNIVSLYGSISYLDNVELKRLKEMCDGSHFYFFMHYQDDYQCKIFGKTKKKYNVKNKFKGYADVKFYKWKKYIIVSNKELDLKKYENI
jgi:hypothetical protein